MSRTPLDVQVPSSQPASNSLLPYVAPMFAFLLLTNVESSLASSKGDDPAQSIFPYLYAFKLIVVGGILIISLVRFGLWRELVPLPRGTDLALAIVLGILVIALWIGLDGYYPSLGFLGQRTSFDPTVLPTHKKWLFLVARLSGLVLLVPVFEELFWRSFLIRCLVDSDFAKVPVGCVTPFAALASSTLFGLAHPEWLPAFLTGLLWAWLLKRTRSLSACVVSHLVANLTLGIYVLYSHEWRYW